MMSGNPLDLPYGGACLWQLPSDARCASHARSVLRSTMTTLACSEQVIDEGTLAISELATNAYQHAMDAEAAALTVAPELWIWNRTHPQPQLTITVFDDYHDASPEITKADPLEEHGKGLGIVAAVSASWGSHPSRSRLTPWPVPGKAVWFGLPLPQPWPHAPSVAEPGRTSRRLHALLTERGIDGVILKDDGDAALLSMPGGLDIRVGSQALVINDLNGSRSAARCQTSTTSPS